RVEARGRGDLGGSRTEPALHALDADGLARVRPRDPLPRGLRPRRAGRPLARPPRRDPRPGLATLLEREKQAFTQSYESTDLDASVLLIPLVGFLPATDPRMLSTVEAIRRELTVEGLILRYRPQGAGVDGLPGDEGVFLACSFWLASVLALR